MAPGQRFDWHTHPEHKVAAAAAGVLMVAAETATWVLPPTRALWIPAGTPHEVLAYGRSTMRNVHLSPAHCPDRWAAPQPLRMTPLLANLIAYLTEPALADDARARAEAVLLDLLEPVDQVTIETPLPTDPRARDVADALVRDPADPRTLPQWGAQVGASARTLARAFAADTGIPFGRWRTALRLRAALPLLATGEPVGKVARRVGYETASAFVAAFRRETGLTPAAYFAAAPM
jgi:AraC-like DNA-binding protein